MNLLIELDDHEQAGDEEFCALVQEIAALATGPAPRARPALMAVLTHGLSALSDHPGPVAVPAPVTPPRRVTERLQSAKARVVLGVGVVSVGLFSTGAAGALPGPAQSAFERAATAVGIELPGAARDSEGAPGRSDRVPEWPDGSGGQQGKADDGSSTSGRTAPPPAPSVDHRDAGVTRGQVPPTITGGNGNRGGALNREAEDEGPTRPPLRPPKSPSRPDAGGPPLDRAPRPAPPGAPDFTDPGRLDGMPGPADDDEQEDGPGRREIPGGLPGISGD